MILAAIVVLNPLGLELIYAAFVSGEQLSRNIWQPIVSAAFLVLTLLIAFEWWIRKKSSARRGLD